MKNVIIIISFTLFIVGCNQNNIFKNDLQLENLKGRVKSYQIIECKALVKFGEITKGDTQTIEQKFFNEKGNITEEQFAIHGGSKHKSTYRFNRNNSKIEEFSYIDDSLFYKTIYIYNEKGDSLKKDLYSTMDSLISKSIISYDNAMNLMEFIIYNADGSLNTKIKYKYDKKGNKIEEQKFDSNGNPFQKVTFEYDINDNVIKNGDYSYTYKFDNQNNWVQKIFYIENKPISIIERVIKYYE